MDKYRRVPKEKEPQENIAANEVRITARGTVRTYISYALGKLNAEGEDEQRTIYLKAMGRTIQKAVSIAEIIKRRVAGLHQITKLDSNTLIDTFEPTVLGLDKKEVQRTVSTITITLSKDSLDEKDIGYQPPLPANLVVSEEEARADRDEGEEGGTSRGRGRRQRRRGGEGRGRGGDRDDRDARPVGRGRGRGGRGGRSNREDDYDSGRGGRRGRGGRGGRGGRSNRDDDYDSGRGGRRGGSGGRSGSSRGGRGGDTGRGGGYGGGRGGSSGRAGGRGGRGDRN